MAEKWGIPVTSPCKLDECQAIICYTGYDIRVGAPTKSAREVAAHLEEELDGIRGRRAVAFECVGGPPAEQAGEERQGEGRGRGSREESE